MKKLYILFDGNNLFYRCYFASRGNRSQAFSIFHRYLEKIKKKFCKTDIEFVFFWDSPQNWRTNTSSDYKETRREQRKGKKPFFDELYFSMDLMKEKLDYKQYQIKGYEADDVISLFIKTVLEKFSKKQYFLIVSTDKDYMQLIADNEIKGIVQLKIGKEWKYITYEKFCKLYKIKPEEYASILALMGDASDNLKGVPGIGEKRAFQVIQKHGDIRNWIFDKDDKEDKLRRKCLDNRDLIQKALFLVDLQDTKILKEETLEL